MRSMMSGRELSLSYYNDSDGGLGNLLFTIVNCKFPSPLPPSALAYAQPLVFPQFTHL